MDKRLILAAAVSLLILLSWSLVTSKLYRVDNKDVIEEIRETAPPAITETAVPIQKPEAVELSILNYSQDNHEVSFIESQAAIREIIFKSYQNYSFSLEHGFFLEGEQMNFKATEVTPATTTFIYSDADKQITKRFSFANSKYTIVLDIEVKSLAARQISIRLPLVVGLMDYKGDQANARLKDISLASHDKTIHINGRKDVTVSGIKFVGLRDRYFCAIVEPDSKNYTAFVKKIDTQKSIVSLRSEEFILAPGQQMTQRFHIYLGPQQLNLINAIRPEWTIVMYFGMFNFISHILLQTLEILHKVLHNWGSSIIVLSVLIYILLYPLSLKQMRSMKQMQLLQPRIEEIRVLYKDNPQKLNKEIIELYRAHKINPMSGCLPMLLQIPVFFALYQALIRFVALKGAHFLWIRDLSEPDRLFSLPFGLPKPYDSFNLLPILMTLGMFIQQKFSMSTTSTGSAEQQKFMMILFPLMFGFIFYGMPSGLVLYWFINSTLMLLHQLKISRKK